MAKRSGTHCAFPIFYCSQGAPRAYDYLTKTKNKLVITSQETTLLSQDMINENRGVVWFVEKNKETASSEYARGDSFGLHKNLSLYNSYRIGRLGAKPELGSIFINLED